MPNSSDMNTSRPASFIMTFYASRWRLWVSIAMLTHFTLFFLLGLSRHWGYITSLNDLGMFDQPIWGTMHGDFFLNTSNMFSQPINWLGYHFNPILLAFVPLYAIEPSPNWMTLAQAFALAISAWPIFLLASRVCQSEKAGLLWALAFLVNPFVLNAAAWDFHPVTLSVPFIALGMLAIEKADTRLLILSCIPLMLIQEHLGPTIAGLGLLWRLHNRNWHPAAILMMLGLAHLVLVVGFIMPALSPTGNHPMLANGTGQASRYIWLGHSVPEVLKMLITHPLAVFKIMMSEIGGTTYIARLLIPLLGLPLAASGFLLPGASDLAANLLSSNPLPRNIIAYHSAPLIAVFTISAVYGSRRIFRWTQMFSLPQWAGLALVASCAMGHKFAPLPLPFSYNTWQPVHLWNLPDSEPEKIRAMIGGNASVSAQGNVGAHFSHRREIYLYPNQLGKAQVVILRLESPTYRLLPPENENIATLAHLLQMNPKDYLHSVDCLLSDKQYGVLLWDDPWLVMSRDARSSEVQVQDIRRKIQQLHTDWLIKDTVTGECSPTDNASVNWKPS